MRVKFFNAVFADAVILTAAAALLGSCQNPTAVTGTNKKATIQVDTVGYKQIVGQSITSTLYLNIVVKWRLVRNISRVDSLADWFAQSHFKIEDMWFPALDPICAIPYNTFNFIYVSLALPDTLIDTLGFKPNSSPSVCFPMWKHYKFIWNRGGQ